MAAVTALEKKEIIEEVENSIEEKPAESRTVISPEPNIVSQPPAVKKYFETEGMTVPKAWEGDGYIVGEKDKKYLISQGDTVYLNLGSGRVKPGTELMIYRKFDKLRDPKTGKVLGYEVRRIGRVEVTNSIEPTTSTAKVIVSYEPIEAGDMVKILEAGR